jgi:acetolactate synthase-1/3 small subunit
VNVIASSHTISVLVDNEPGILARVVGLFSGRGYNIESLTVAETDAKENLSRITIVTAGTPMVIEQIKAQLDRLVPVHKVRDLTVEGPHIERELALVKVRSTGEKRVEALRLADVFRAKVIDAKTDSFVFEVTGTTEKVDSFIGLMSALGLVDIGRTGIVAMTRGGEALSGWTSSSPCWGWLSSICWPLQVPDPPPCWWCRPPPSPDGVAGW